MSTRPVYPNVRLTIGTSPLRPIKGDHRYFSFSQNNSGGSFDIDKEYGEYVIISAKDANHANERAQEIGLYFDGVDNGSDCECCGDRWSTAYGPGEETPLIYDKRPEVAVATGGWSRSTIVVHHADGTRETYERIEEKEESLDDLVSQ